MTTCFLFAFLTVMMAWNLQAILSIHAVDQIVEHQIQQVSYIMPSTKDTWSSGMKETPPKVEAGREELHDATGQFQQNNYSHVVFLGDSTLRYSFLEILDQFHFDRQGENSPPGLINEKLHNSWHEYFENTTNHFEGYMTCDCQRGEVFDLGSETENRYYRNPAKNMYATYLQGYGDNEAHGRFQPHEAKLTRSNDTTTHRYIFRYLGARWGELIENVVAQLEPRPTAIVINAGLWPNDDIARSMGKILGASRKVVGQHGKVIWRGVPRRRDDKKITPSQADLAALDWSYRIPGITYQEFPKTLSFQESDFFDKNHFANPAIYRAWNKNLLSDASETSVTKKKHLVFIMVGAVRTLSLTEPSTLENLILPLCCPSDCIAHLVTHFSYTDNRPDVGGNDPLGTVIRDATNTTQAFFQNHSFPDGYLHIHPVPGYDIGSPDELAAMETMEREADATLRGRMHLARVGDPRRYSMWFARAWAWRYTKSELLKHVNPSLFAFTRPDMLWMMPVPTRRFFEDMTSNRELEVWTHDTYFSDIPDTFAFMLSYNSADIYLSLDNLLDPQAFCLGGPNFDRTLAESRIKANNITMEDDGTKWCQGGTYGWSEQILQRKMKAGGMSVRRLPVSAVILRPPNIPLCQPLHPKHHIPYAKHSRSYAAYSNCLTLYARREKGVHPEAMQKSRPFVLRGRTRKIASQCLTMEWTPSGEWNMTESPCIRPPPQQQTFFAGSFPLPPTTGLHWWNITYAQEKYRAVSPSDWNADRQAAWIPEPVELYSRDTLTAAAV